MRRITLEEKQYLAVKLIYALRVIPAYHRSYHGLRAEYGKYLTFILTGPDDHYVLPLTKFQFEKIIYQTLKTYGYESSGYVSYMGHEYRIKKGRVFGRNKITVIIRRIKRFKLVIKR